MQHQSRDDAAGDARDEVFVLEIAEDIQLARRARRRAATLDRRHVPGDVELFTVRYRSVDEHRDRILLAASNTRLHSAAYLLVRGRHCRRAVVASLAANILVVPRYRCRRRRRRRSSALQLVDEIPLDATRRGYLCLPSSRSAGLDDYATTGNHVVTLHQTPQHCLPRATLAPGYLGHAIPDGGTYLTVTAFDRAASCARRWICASQLHLLNCLAISLFSFLFHQVADVALRGWKKQITRLCSGEKPDNSHFGVLSDNREF